MKDEGGEVMMKDKLMKTRDGAALAAMGIWLVVAGAVGTGGTVLGQVGTAAPGTNLSLKNEVERAIDRGVAWLKSNQDPETGVWGDPQYPAITALALAALAGDPSRPAGGQHGEVEAAREFLLKNVKADAGIYGKGLATYNTALSLKALLLLNRDEDLDVIMGARRFLINQQADFDAKGETDNPFDGGIGYGGTYAHSDLSNTHLVLEALYLAKQILPERGVDLSQEYDLDWDAAIRFVERCQNLPGSNDQDWVSEDKADRGGFVYFPGKSMAEEEGKPLRSYGSMSYAGLLSFIYAEVDMNDPRVAAVMEWLGKNYSVEENPGMGASGLFYYYHTMAKALATMGLQTLPLADGKAVDWRHELALRLFDEQAEDGSWRNEGSSRWWEDDRALVTAYSLLSLQLLHASL